MTKGKTKHSLTWYLNKYFNIQKDIWLVYRPTLDDTWADRCNFLGKGYMAVKPYNHRSVLQDEIVIEFDDESTANNLNFAKRVITRLKNDNVHYALFYSGNKSYHIHFFVDTSKVKNRSVLKKTIMKHYTDNISVPDYRLCADNHLIRAENGVHEKTGKDKRLIEISYSYPRFSRLPQDVWDKYVVNQKISIGVRTQNYVSNLEHHKAFQYILQSEKFRLADDGRERAMFMLIHVLKNGKFKDDKEGLTKFLQEWYAYSGGVKMTEQQIKHKVQYHWNKQYSIGINYLRELLESIGKEGLLE